ADADAELAAAAMERANERAFLMTCLALGAAMIVVAAAGIVLARQIGRRAIRTARVLESVAAGDLICELEVGARDELGDMATALNAMVASLREALGSFGRQATRLGASSEKLSAVSVEVAENARGTASQATHA